MTKQFPVRGLKELDAYLSAFPKNLQKGAVRSGLRQAANQIADEAKLRAKGRLAKSITVGSARVNEDGKISIRVYVDESIGIGFVGYFQEFGVRPHLIGSTGKGEGRIAIRKAKAGTGTVENGVMKIGDDFASGIISHPGHAPNPFLRPALDVKAKQAVEAFADQVQEYLYSKTGLMAPYVEVGEAA